MIEIDAAYLSCCCCCDDAMGWMPERGVERSSGATTAKNNNLMGKKLEAAAERPVSLTNIVSFLLHL